MNLLTAEHLKKSYTERLLFDDVAFSIGEGDKIGLIGINGTGKMPDLRMRREASLRSFWTLDISTRTAIFTRIKRAFIPGGRTGLRHARRMLGGGLIISVFPRA